jgi:hypothetical protein
MLYLLTGSPGSGKTLSAIEIIRRTQLETPDRIIYAANIEGLNIPGVIILDDDGIRSWHQSCEKNSLIVVDEAQRYWRAQRSGEPSQAIIEMETHRHDGIDIVMMTQHPTFLHSNIRKLVNEHTHLIAYTKKSSLRYVWRECHDDVQDNALRQSGEFSEWHYDPSLYEFYTSSTMHTKRAKRPMKQVMGRVALVFAGVCMLALLGVAGWKIYDYTNAPSILESSKSAIAAAGVPSRSAVSAGSVSDRAVSKYSTTAEFVAAQIPRVAAQPYSAPIYDGQAVTSHPQVFCIRVEDEEDCSCITEQGTRYAVNNAMCRELAEYGPPYDPFKPQKADVAVQQSQQAPSPSVSSSDPVVAGVVGVEYNPGSRFPSIPQQYVPPTYGQWSPE